MKKVATLAKVLELKHATKYDEVEVYGETIRLGSLDAAGMTAWLDEIKDGDGDRFSGLFLVSRCVVDGEGNRLSDPQRAQFVQLLMTLDPRENKKLIRPAQELNGIGKKPETERKNDSSEASAAPITGASPID